MKNERKKVNIDSLNPQFITDEKGNKTYVVLKLENFETLLEDYQDLALISERKNDEFVSLDDAIKEIND